MKNYPPLTKQQQATYDKLFRKINLRQPVTREQLRLFLHLKTLAALARRDVRLTNEVTA
ncbi:MAG: hypothetical protein WCI05_02870 [Myxococcales bacterium]